jgi:hypothetical protein
MSAVDYNDAIVNEQNKIIEHILAMSNATYDIAESDQHRLKIIEQCDSSIAIVGAMEPFDGNSDLRDAAVNLFRFYKDIASTDFKRILDILDMDEPTDADYEELDQIDAKIAERELPLDAAFQNAQKAFSDKHNLQLLKNEYQDAIDGM